MVLCRNTAVSHSHLAERIAALPEAARMETAIFTVRYALVLRWCSVGKTTRTEALAFGLSFSSPIIVPYNMLRLSYGLQKSAPKSKRRSGKTFRCLRVLMLTLNLLYPSPSVTGPRFLPK